MKKTIATIFLFFLFASPTMATGVEYTLPRVEILPDNPAYIFNIARDNILSFFIRDPKQKSFYLLYLSDSRLVAGRELVNKGKISAGAAVIWKGQEYYTKAVDTGVKVQDLDLTSKLIVAGSKHEDVITNLQAKLTGNDAGNLNIALAADQKDKNRVLELLLQPQK